MLTKIRVILIALLAGVAGGLIGGAMPHGTIKARDFILVDATGAQRATLAILPDGNAHLVVIDQRNPQQLQMWPQTRRPMTPAEFFALAKVAKIVVPLLP
jgi:hypothetical protein